MSWFKNKEKEVEVKIEVKKEKKYEYTVTATHKVRNKTERWTQKGVKKNIQDVNNVWIRIKKDGFVTQYTRGYQKKLIIVLPHHITSLTCVTTEVVDETN